MNALFDMESYVIDFIVTQDGSTTNLSGRQFEKRTFNESSIRSKLPEGHYIVSNCKRNRDFTKMCIWRKFTGPVLVKGWFWNSERMETQWEKVMSIFITEYNPEKITAQNPVGTTNSTNRSGRATRTRVHRDPHAPRDMEFDKKAYGKFLDSFKKLECLNMLNTVYNENIRLPVDKQTSITLAILRTKFRNEFTKCPRANQKRTFLKKSDDGETAQEKLCASILIRCKDLRERAESTAVIEVPDTPEKQISDGSDSSESPESPESLESLKQLPPIPELPEESESDSDSSGVEHL